MQQPLIQFRQVYKQFGNNQVLNGVDLDIFGGEITTVIGKSGGGKSVLLKHIIGLIEPDSGAILFKGKTIAEMAKAERRALKKKFSYMFQSTALFDSMTVFENIALPLQEKMALPAPEIHQRVHAKMQQLDLKAIDTKYPSQLSGGMKKRVALARALITEPEIVLFDEPTTGLDPIRKNAVHNMISEYQRHFGFTGVVVSHEIPDIFFISQRIAMLNEGRILFAGSPEEIQRASDPVVQQFIHGLEGGRDQLTGLVSRSAGEQRFKEEMARLLDHEMAFSLVVFTIENLEEINSKLGYMEAQNVLKHFVAQVENRLQVTDFCTRSGLNKIMVVLSNTRVDQARAFCDQLARELKSSDILKIQPYPGFCFTVNTGFAEGQRNVELTELLARAESKQNRLERFNVC
jgi:phospholipid/cholesterol/gamma-HCH transport system ATP-binding protein